MAPAEQAVEVEVADPATDLPGDGAKEAKPASGGAKVPAGRGAPSVLAGRYLIFHGRPAPDLDGPTAKAFHVEDRKEADRKLFALIVPPNVPDRINRGDSLRKSGMVGAFKPIEWGPVEWPPHDQHCRAVVYERPPGGRVMTPGEKHPGFNNVRDLQRIFIEPMVGTIRELHAMGMTHRGIRPDNMFYADAGQQRVVLGDCLTVPPGYDQPAVFETIERGMCQPAGRGAGDTREDLYALGVSLVFLLLGFDPVARLSDDELIERKISDGSYATICGNERIPVSLLELLRGVLSDDAIEGWGLDEIQLWIDGRRMSPIQRKAAKKADRGFPIGDKEYDNLRALALGFSRHPDLAVKAMREGHLLRWIRRNLEAPDIAVAMEGALVDLDNAKGDRQRAEAEAIANLCLRLDPQGPIRYKNLAFLPEGIGPVFAAEMLGGDPKDIIGILLRGIHKTWFRGQSQAMVFEKRIDAMEKWLRAQTLGAGPERCLYEFNFTLPCQSQLVAGRHVTELSELMRALDEVAEDVDPKTPPIDRHVAAFVASRLGNEVEAHLTVMADPGKDRQVLGMLSLLALVQWRTGIETLYGLTRWMGNQVGPALETYHSRQRRREIERDIPKLARKGSLTELYNRIEDPDARQEDFHGFLAAQKAFHEAEEEVNAVQSRALDRATMEEAAQRVSAVVAVLFTIATTVMIFLVRT